MSRRKVSVPQYRLHRSTGQACCYVNRKRVYLGVYDSPESKRRYSELIARLQAEPSRRVVAVPATNSPQPVYLAQLLLKYATEELPRYSRDEQHCQKGVIRIVRQLFGETLANDFGPLKLRTVRDSMLESGWSVGFVNRQVKRLRLMLRWGVSFELASPSVMEGLRTVASLPDPESGSRARRAIPQADIEAVRGVLEGLHRDLFDLMLMTGCRSGELVGLASGDINRTGEVWRADLEKHKTSHKGKGRTLFFNSSAQSILKRYLSAKPDQKLFDIRRDTFGKVVKAACLRAGVKPFTPHWLRHTVATRLADEMGVEAAQRLLGHAGRAMTEHYTRAAEKVAIEASRRLG